MITRLRIKNYRAIEAFDEVIPPTGIVARGRNGAGKTTILRAIRAALQSEDIGPDAIRDGADQAEILVDLDKLARVRRTITPDRSTVTVETGEGDHVARMQKPHTWLKEMIGNSAFDPIDFYMAKPADRKAQLLAVLPVQLTTEHLEKWLPEWARKIDELPKTDGMHGLDAVEAHRKFFYDRRTHVNAVAKRIQSEVEVEERKLEKIREGLPKEKIDFDAVRAKRFGVGEELQRLRFKAESAAKDSKRVGETRAKVAELRGTAEKVRAGESFEDVWGALDAQSLVLNDLDERIADARKALQSLEEQRATAKIAHEAAAGRVKAHDEAKRMDGEADNLAATIGDVEEAPSEEKIAELLAEFEGLAQKEATAVKVAIADDAAALVERRRLDLKAEQENADALTEIVDFLRLKAPSELIMSVNGIPGVGIDEDTITLDGHRIDSVSGREQLLFAIEIAKRANKSKILVLDKLEVIDPDMLPAVLAKATSGGYQLLATRVDRGDIVLEAIPAAEEAEAAQ